MPSVIRYGAFETNSSSSHSITIQAGDYILDRTVLDVIYPGEFGWGVDDFYDAETKASYAWTWILMSPEYTQETLIAKLTRVIKATTGVTPDLRRSQSSDVSTWHRGDFDGYIDHQSAPDEGGDGQKMFDSDESLRDFIFNPASRLHICNDNDRCRECEIRVYGD